MKILLINEPADYFELLEINISDQLCKKNETPDLVHLFVKIIKCLKRNEKAKTCL